jgi:Putative zinc-finger
MKTGCSTYQSQIPKALMGELNPLDQQALESHIEECAVCFRERELYARTVKQLSWAGDVSVPRHFFVYSEEPPASRWQALPRLLLSWRTAALAAGLAAVVLALAPMQVRSERGAFVLSFGRPTGTAQPLASPEAVDVAKLKAELLSIVEEKSRADRLEVIRTMRAELASSNAAFSRKQRALLEAALAGAETRLNERLADTATSLETGTRNSLALLYRNMALQSERDFTAVNDRLNRLALSGEIKSNQTDAILETLLEVAEVRMK